MRYRRVGSLLASVVGVAIWRPLSRRPRRRRRTWLPRSERRRRKMTPTRCSRLRSCTRWDGTYRVTGSSRCACSSVRLQKGMLQHKRALACSIRPERASRGTMLAHSSCSASPRRPVTWKVNTGWACHSATESVLRRTHRSRCDGLPRPPTRAIRKPSLPSASCSSKARAARRTSSPRGDGYVRPRPGAIESWRVRRLRLSTNSKSIFFTAGSAANNFFWGSVRRYSSRPWPLMRWVPKPRFVMTHPIP